MDLIFDTETTGKANFKLPPEHFSQPRVVQIAAMLVNGLEEVAVFSVIIKPEGFTIPEEASAIHGITTQLALERGIPIKVALSLFNHLGRAASRLVAFNAAFDELVLRGEFARVTPITVFDERPVHCAMLQCKPILKLPGQYGDFKWPKLSEAHEFFFGEGFDGAHDALADVRATVRVLRASTEWEQKQVAGV